MEVAEELEILIEMQITQDGLPEPAESLDAEKLGGSISGRCHRQVHCHQPEPVPSFAHGVSSD